METLQNAKIDQEITALPMEATSKYHRKLAEKYANITSEDAPLNENAKALMLFNGYYAMPNVANGAFFTVDTNMHLKQGSTTPIYDVTLIISLDGLSSKRYDFTGTFDGKTLIQGNKDTLEQLYVNIEFKRENKDTGITASFTGSISLPQATTPTAVVGSTYNNPIKYDIYEGTYYQVNEKTSQEPIKTLKIQNNYEISFDYGANNEKLKKVPSFSYNLNMYFFSFTKGEQLYHLIMGTGGAKGLVAGNMTITSPNSSQPTITSRQLITITNPTIEKPKTPNFVGKTLANFSGYYSLPSINSKAFLSIQAEYIDINFGKSLDIYSVLVSYSLDGTTSKGVYFNEGTMNFKNNTLTIPSENLTINFSREYQHKNRSLVNINGKIGANKITGFTPFNPVPLSAFGSKALTSNNETKDLSLTIINDNEIIYNNTTQKSFIYVPLMYILAYPWEKPTIVMSFGSDGEKGNSCIVTDYSVTPNTTSYVYAVHNKA